MKIVRFRHTLAVAFALFFTSVVSAYEAGDLILRSGYAAVNPKSDGGDVVDVDDGYALGITGTYMITDQIGVALLAATPFEHDIELKNGTDAGSTKHLPPTVSVQCLPNVSWGGVQPYAGIGLNWTTFFEEEADAIGASELELDDSFGLAVELGVDYSFSENWGASLQLWYIDIESDASIDGGPEFDVEIDPIVYMLGLAYKF